MLPISPASAPARLDPAVDADGARDAAVSTTHRDRPAPRLAAPAF
jgi:hypothetical protein